VPLYAFQDETTGEIVEELFPMEEAPGFGERIVIGNRTLVRVVAGAPQAKPAPDRMHTSQSLPRWWPYAPRHDAEGRPQFTGAREIREAQAKAQHDGEMQFYDS